MIIFPAIDIMDGKPVRLLRGNFATAEQVGDIASIPVIINDKIKNKIEKLVNENIEISKADWDSFETSWDFKNHPLI